MAKYETMMVTTANLDEEASNALINKFAFSRSLRAFFAA